MKVKQQSVVDFLGQPNTQFVVPVFQRVYTWQRPQLRELWDDLMACGKDESSHFMGNIFYSVEPSHHDGIEQFDIIDGQQRMTTFTLLMCAVCKYLRTSGGDLDGMSAEAVADKFLRLAVGGNESGKLVLSRADAPTLRWVVGVGEKPTIEEEYSKRVVEAYEWFCDRFESESFDYAAFERGIQKLYVVAVEMEDQDRQQTVFESLNSKGLPLSTPDLVRNFLLMRSEFDDQSYLYDTYWADVEDAFSEDADDRYLAHAIRMWTGAGNAIKDDRGIFDAFKASFTLRDKVELEKRTAGLAEYCIEFHKKVADGDEATIKACREWEENRGKAERLRNDRKIFGD